MGYITVARDLWQRKPTLSSGIALGLGRFTAINPWRPGSNYYINCLNLADVSSTAVTIYSQVLFVGHCAPGVHAPFPTSLSHMKVFLPTVQLSKSGEDV